MYLKNVERLNVLKRFVNHNILICVEGTFYLHTVCRKVYNYTTWLIIFKKVKVKTILNNIDFLLNDNET